MKRLVVIAIGGNSLISDSQHMTVFDQYRAAGETAEHMVSLVAEGYQVVIVHGNGPQVGFILLRSEIAKDVLHEVPLDTCGADTQGAIGYQIAQNVDNALKSRGIQKTVAAVVTQVVVDGDDEGFVHPAKPIGPFYSEDSAQAHQSREGWQMVEDSGRGWRRVVASPEPLEIVEEKAIRHLLEMDAVVVAGGGGGIPVVRDEDGLLRGAAAVIDKDKTASLLGKRLGAEIMMISTSVERVAINWRQPDQRDIDRMTVAEAKQYLAEGQFAPGSMKPKIEASIDFLENGGQKVFITEPHLLEAALAGTTGTLITP